MLKKTPLFFGVEEADRDAMLSCLASEEKEFSKGSFLCRQGEKAEKIGIVLEGSVHIIKEDFWGNRRVIGQVSPGDLFGEVYACLPEEEMEVSVVAAEEVKVLFLSFQKVLSPCSHNCRFHTKLISNLLSVMAEKNLSLTRKIEHMGKRTTKEKLLSYLSAESLRQGSVRFSIPFNRQQLADYLAVDRSAMSAELGKLKREGVLDYHKNHFYLRKWE